MTKYTLPLTLLGLLLLTNSCRHHAKPTRPSYTQEEAQPVSSLPQHEFSKVDPRSSNRR